MSEENPTPAAEAPAAAPVTAAPTESPKQEQPATEAKPDTRDYKEAYIGLNRTVEKLHRRIEQLTQPNPVTKAQLDSMNEAVSLIASQSLPPEQAKALQERQRYAAERAAALQAAEVLQQNVAATITALDRVMESAGLEEDDRKAVYLAAKSTGNVQEWAETVHALASDRIAQKIAARISRAEGEIKAKTAAEIKAEAEAQAARIVRESGVDKVDTGTGGTASTKKSIAEMNDAEYAVFSQQQAEARRERLMRRMGGASR